MTDRTEFQAARECRCEIEAQYGAPWLYMGPWHAKDCWMYPEDMKEASGGE